MAAATGLIADATATAPLLVAYSSSRFRLAGHGSLASMLPIANANDDAIAIGRSVVATRPGLPLVVGLCGQDVTRSNDDLLDEVEQVGFLGVQNFPTVSIIDGVYREDLEATGLGFAREIELLRAARRRGLLTLANVATAAEATMAALAGVDVVTPHLGVTRASADSGRALDDAIDRLNALVSAVRSVRDNAFIVFHGGPVATPTDLDTVLKLCPGIDGYIGASTFERTPVMRAVADAFQAWTGGTTAAAAGVDLFSEPAPDAQVQIDETNLPDYLLARHLVQPGEPVKIETLGGGVSNVIYRFTAPSRQGVLKQSRPLVRVAEEWRCDLRRVLNEREAISCVAPLVGPDRVPAITFVDDENYAFVMDSAPADAVMWKEHLFARRIDPAVGYSAGQFLAQLHENTRGNNSLRRRFANEPLLAQLRLDPWYGFTARRHPDVADAIRMAARRLVEVQEVLVHGDFVAKNILLWPGGMMVLDWEVVHYGNPGYDVGQMLAHLALKAATFPDRSAGFLDTAHAFWNGYRRLIPTRTAQAVSDEATLQMGALLLARLDGKSPVDYVRTPEARARVGTLGTRLLRQRPPSLDDAWPLVHSTLTEEAANV